MEASYQAFPEDRRNRKAKVVGGVVGAGILLVMLSCAFFGGSGSVKTYQGVELKTRKVLVALRQNEAQVEPQSLAAESAYDTQCFQATGGECNVFSCHASRHATCVRHGFGDHRCDCPTGKCVGEDFTCHDGRNIRIGTSFTFKNKKTDDTMYVESPDAQLGLTKGPGGDQHFTLHQLPGTKKKFIITPSKYPDHVLLMSFEDGLVTRRRTYDVTDASPSKAVGKESYFFWTICEVTKGSNQLHLGVDLTDGVHWASVVSSKVHATPTADPDPDTDDMATWIANPPLPFDVDLCK